jgi:hypothetical protein
MLDFELSLLFVLSNPESFRGCAFVHSDRWWLNSIPEKKSLLTGIKSRDDESGQ